MSVITHYTNFTVPEGSRSTTPTKDNGDNIKKGLGYSSTR
jgi:hypothetical protein